MSTAGLEWAILGPAFLAGLLVLSTHVPLGREVLERGIIFIDLAIAQIAALGVIAAHSAGLESAVAVQAAAAGAALLGALAMTWSERHWPQNQEALIGTAFVLAASLGLLLLADNPHGGEHLKDLLAGQILWVSGDQNLMAALLYLPLLTVWFGLRRRLGRAGFYLIFALAVTASVQLVGVYLVFASLILPALATQRLSGRRQLAFGYLTGIAGYALGLLVSAIADLPSGPAIVCSLAGVAALAATICTRPAGPPNRPA
jgi:zinc/manganese transport system permease protein